MHLQFRFVVIEKFLAPTVVRRTEPVYQIASVHRLGLVQDVKSLGNEFSFLLNSILSLVLPSRSYNRQTAYAHLIPEHSSLTFGPLISEQKIDRIELRLGNIEALLRNSPHRPIPVPTTQHRPIIPSTVDTGTTSPPDFGTPDAGSVFGSNSVITQQTSFANELIEHVMKRNSLRDIDPRMSEALANLRQIMEVQRQSPITYGPRFPLQQSLPPGGLGQLEMPPVDAVVSLLRNMKCI